MKLSELSYYRNSADVFQAIAVEPWSIFFDSGFPFIDQGRYDIIAGWPYATAVTRGP
ncbi:MAG: aminodeoxychorismate synthase component I, partial [Gammaproteobacteria bacterium]|nr:aminodeoxychorismate synthase component I [Gammaproteobacteria bacterium]